MAQPKIDAALIKLSLSMKPITMAIVDVLQREAELDSAPMVTLVCWGTAESKWVLYSSNAERQTVIEGLEELITKLKADQAADAPPVPLHERN